jgi:hypothetical protein
VHRDGACLSASLWWDQTGAATTCSRSAEHGRAGGDLPRSGLRALGPCDRCLVGAVAVDDQPGSQRQRRPTPLLGRAGGPGWPARATRPKPCKLAGNPTLRAIVEEKLARRWSPQQIDGWLKLTYPKRPEMQGVAREHLPHPLRAVTRCTALGTDPVSAHRPGEPTPERRAAARRPRRTAEHAAHLRAAARGRGPEPCPGTGKATWSSART